MNKYLLALLCFFAQTCSVFAGETIAWMRGNHVTVQLSSAGEKDSTRYELWVASPKDIRIERSEESAGKKKSGTILLVGGRFLALRGIDVEPGMEIDAMDLAALSWQLTAQLLDRAFPGGPPSAFPSKEVLVTEASQSLEVGTTSAEGAYGAPWTLKAKATRDASGHITYRLNFAYTDSDSGKPASPITIIGTWENLQSNVETPASMSLEGWNVFSLGPTQRQQGEGQILDYGTSSSKNGAQTVGDLKKKAEQQH